MKIFVFGSNLAGRHGAGAARHASQYYGAIYGKGVGIQGTGQFGSSYAIPTKDSKLASLKLSEIKHYIDDFMHYVYNNPEHKYLLTPVGCGLAGYSRSQIRPLFENHKLFAECKHSIIFLSTWSDFT